MLGHIFDVVAFYDSEIAQNLYLRTATDTGALRLVGLIGYHLRPAVAADFARGRSPIRDPRSWCPRGRHSALRPSATSRRRSESDADLMISPHTNKWTLAPVMRAAAKAGPAALRHRRPAPDARGDYDFTWTGTTTIAKVTAVDPIRAVDGKSYASVTTDPAVSIPARSRCPGVVTRVPTGTAGINRIDTAPVIDHDPARRDHPQISAGRDPDHSPAAASIFLVSVQQCRGRCIDAVQHDHTRLARDQAHDLAGARYRLDQRSRA
jgi:hypothetical protein